MVLVEQMLMMQDVKKRDKIIIDEEYDVDVDDGELESCGEMNRNFSF